MASLADIIIQQKLEDFFNVVDNYHNLNEIDEYGFTPLIEAVLTENIEIINHLISLKVLIDKADTSGRTALFWAVYNNNFEITNILLNAAANPNAVTKSGHPIIAYPLIRKKTSLIKLLQKFNGSINLGMDFINVKLIGHRFELTGQTYIKDPNNKYILVSFSGFYAEASINMFADSINKFKNNYTSKNLKQYFSTIDTTISALKITQKIAAHQHYTVTESARNYLLNSLNLNEILILPVLYQGHAISITFYDKLLIKCDRGANSKKEPAIIVYKINNAHEKQKIISQLLFHVNDDNYIHSKINNLLNLKVITHIPITSQIVGNCTWANIESSILIVHFLLQYQKDQNNIQSHVEESIKLYHLWHRWDLNNTLDIVCQKTNFLDKRDAIIFANVLGNILMKLITQENNTPQIQKITSALQESNFIDIIKNYQQLLKVYNLPQLYEKIK